MLLRIDDPPKPHALPAALLMALGSGALAIFAVFDHNQTGFLALGFVSAALAFRIFRECGRTTAVVLSALDARAGGRETRSVIPQAAYRETTEA